MNASAPQRPLVSPALLPVLGLALALALTLPPLSSTRLQTWPLASAATAFWLLPVVVALVRLARGRPLAHLGGLADAAFLGLAATGVLSTVCSPLRDTIAPALLPFLGALALPYALLPVLASSAADRLVSAFAYPLLFTCALLWLSDTAGRNAQPFGHANTTGAVCALAACALAGVAWRSSTRVAQTLHAGGAALAVALSASSSSRGAALALAAATIGAGGIHLLRRGRFLLFAVLTLLAVAAAVLTNQRLRDLVLTGAWSAAAGESNAQREAMIRGGLALATHRPLLGWGPGSVPHAFPSVRAGLPGTPDNYLHLHNTPAQTAATLGVAGMAAVSALLVALARRVRSILVEPAHTPLVAALICTIALLLFDHPFATPAFALLAALPVAALGLATVKPAHSRRRLWAWPVLAIVGACLALPVGRDLAARAAWASALDSAAADRPADYATALRRARVLAPADPFYADKLASHLATGSPFPGLQTPAPAESVSIWKTVAARNPAHEIARYNLGWLLLSEDPAAAREHFTAAARLAPARAEVWLGLALARIRSGSADSPVPALAAEALLDPAFAWSPRWHDAALAPHRADALALAADYLAERDLAPLFAAWLRNPGPPVDYVSAYRRVRTGHGVLYGHPDGPAPADANILLELDLPQGVTSVLPARGFVAPADLLALGGLASPQP